MIVFAAYVVLAAVAIFGEVLIFYFNALLIHNVSWVAEEVRPHDDMRIHQLIKELIEKDEIL